jgi:hypothetical protein
MSKSAEEVAEERADNKESFVFVIDDVRPGTVA